MKVNHKAFAVTLGTLIGILFTAIYVVSCLNAGQALSWDSFTEGLLVHVSNCGGNSAARAGCRNIALNAVVLGSDSGGIFNFTKLSQQQQDEQAEEIRSVANWTAPAKYLLRVSPVQTGPGTHEVVVVCDTPFGIVPQPSIWNLHHRSLRHAAGYSDGSSGWLTPSQFAELNKSSFVALKFLPMPMDSQTNAASFE